jgi:hypothetical protein
MHQWSQRQEAHQTEEPTLGQARAERSAMESLLCTLKDGFEIGELMRRNHENVLAEMLEKVLVYNVFSDHPGVKKAFRAGRDRMRSCPTSYCGLRP